MKKTLFLFLAAVLSAIANAAGPEDFPKGGVSLDFSQTFKTEKSSGKNFLFDGDFETKPLAKNPFDQWQSHYYVHAPKHELPDPSALRAKLDPLLTQKIISENGGKCLELSSPAAIMQYRPKGKPMLSNRISQYIDLPVLNAPTKFQLSLRYKGKIDNVPGLNAFHVFAFFKDNIKLHKSKDTRKMVNHGLKVSGKWTTGTVSFIAPPNTRKLGISLALYGCGRIFIDDVKLVKVKAADGVVAKLIPCSFLDKIFVLSQNDPAVMAFAFKNEKNTKIDKPCLYLKLPEGFEVVDARYITSLIERKNITENGKKYTVCKIDLSKLKNNFGKEQLNTYNLASVMVKSSLPAGTEKYPASYWYQDGKYRTEAENIEFKIISEIKSRQPKIFQTGAMVRREGDFIGKGVEGFIDLYRNTGFNIVHGLSTAEMNAAYKKAGILRYTQPFYLCNGYRIGTDDKPDNVKFQLADGSYRNKPHQAICPAAVYKQDPYYREKVLDRIKDILVNKDSSDSIMPNWEPYMFDFKGCFCPRCKEEFIKYSGIDKAEIDKAWPSQIIIKFKDKWVKFRSWQHAQLCIQLEKDISRIGKSAGKDSHFVPEIAWSQLLENSNPHFAQYNPKDYMGKLPILEPWGPYIFYKFDEPYVYNPGIHLITYTAARDIKKFIAKHIPDAAKRPKTIAFPHGYQLDSWVTEPEALAFETLCFFLNGWEGSIAYVFPKGYDNRWWKAMSKANKSIAEYEDFVFKGEKISASAAVPVSPVPKPEFPEFWSEGGNFMQKLPSLKDAAIVQTIEYKLGDKRLVAVGNFWQKGEVFVRLSVDNLQPAAKYVLREPDYKRCFASGGSAALTSRQLKKGITVHIGALRWAFFIIEPYRKDAGYGEAISAKFMQSLLTKRLPEIEKAVKWEKKYQADRQAQAARENALPDYSNIKTLNNKGVSCRKLGNTIEFNWKNNLVTIDPAAGGRVKSWICGKTQLVSQDDNLGFCIDAFWWPSKAACHITSPYKVMSQNKTANGLNLVLERKLTPKDKLFLTDCVITKTYEVCPGSLKVTTKITNTTGVEKEFSFRWHNMPALLEFHGAKGGEALLVENGKEVVFKRLFARKMLRYAAGRDADLEGLFKLEQAATISKPEIVFSSTWSPVKLTAGILSEKELYGIVLWDSGKQKTSSFEPLFKKTVIATGKSWSASML